MAEDNKVRTLALLCAALVACGTAQGVEQSAPSKDLVLLGSESGVDLVARETGRVERQVADGVAAPDRESFISTTIDGDSTTVTRSAPNGAVLSQGFIKGDVQARVVSDDLVALTERGAPGETIYLPAPKARTRIVVLDDDGAQREYDLEGNFEPEAFKVNGAELFMIEYIPALAPERYRVRRLKLRNGAVLPIGRLKLNAPGQMQGTGRTQVMSPSEDELYTLYTHQLDAGHGTAEHVGTGHAFVHLLNLRYGWAHCIDLPAVFASGQATAAALAVHPHGTRVFVADWTQGVVAAVNPRRVRVADTVDVDFGSADEATFAVADYDRLFVAGNDDIVVLDMDTLEVLDRWSFGDEITGLSRVDDRLFVSVRGRVVVREI